MRSYTVFEDFGRGRSRLERPGYRQKQVADDLTFPCGLCQADWHPGWLRNRRGFAFSPHFPHPHDYTPPACAEPSAGRPVRAWPAEKTAESVLISIPFAPFRDDLTERELHLLSF